jgi:hypothetical protein
MLAGRGWRRGGYPKGWLALEGSTIADHVDEPGDVVIGIETDRGLWVQALSAAGYRVYAVNPLAVAHYRDRHQVSGAKSDAGDAKVLADLVRTDRHNLGALAGDSPEAEAIKVLARAHQNLIWARTRHTNVLRSALREYYPAALEAFDDLHDRDALAVLGRASTPADGAHLSLAKICSALKHAGRQRNFDARAQDIAAALRTEQLAALPRRSPPRSPRPPAPRSASSSSSTARSPNLRPNWRHILRHTRTPTSTSPYQDLVSSSAPGCSVRSGTTRTDTPPPSLAKTTPGHHH